MKRLKSPKSVGDFQLTDEHLDLLASMTEGYVGAEVEQIVISAMFEAFSEDRSIQFEDFRKSIQTMVPLSVTQAEQIQGIREWANVRAVAATPQEDREEYRLELDKPEAPAPKEEDVKLKRGGRAIDF